VSGGNGRVNLPPLFHCLTPVFHADAEPVTTDDDATVTDDDCATATSRGDDDDCSTNSVWSPPPLFHGDDVEGYDVCSAVAKLINSDRAQGMDACPRTEPLMLIASYMDEHGVYDDASLFEVMLTLAPPDNSSAMSVAGLPNLCHAVFFSTYVKQTAPQTLPRVEPWTSILNQCLPNPCRPRALVPNLVRALGGRVENIESHAARDVVLRVLFGGLLGVYPSAQSRPAVRDKLKMYAAFALLPPDNAALTRFMERRSRFVLMAFREYLFFLVQQLPALHDYLCKAYYWQDLERVGTQAMDLIRTHMTGLRRDFLLDDNLWDRAETIAHIKHQETLKSCYRSPEHEFHEMALEAFEQMTRANRDYFPVPTETQWYQAFAYVFRAARATMRPRHRHAEKVQGAMRVRKRRNTQVKVEAGPDMQRRMRSPANASALVYDSLRANSNGTSENTRDKDGDGDSGGDDDNSTNEPFKRMLTDVCRWGGVSDTTCHRVHKTRYDFETHTHLTGFRNLLPILFEEAREDYNALYAFFSACSYRLCFKWAALPSSWADAQLKALGGNAVLGTHFVCPKCREISTEPVTFPEGQNATARRESMYPQDICIRMQGHDTSLRHARRGLRRHDQTRKRHVKNDRRISSVRKHIDPIEVCYDIPVLRINLVGRLFLTKRDGWITLCVDCGAVVKWSHQGVGPRGPTCGCFLSAGGLGDSLSKRQQLSARVASSTSNKKKKSEALAPELTAFELMHSSATAPVICGICENATASYISQMFLTDDGVRRVFVCNAHNTSWMDLVEDAVPVFEDVKAAVLRRIEARRLRLGGNTYTF